MDPSHRQPGNNSPVVPLERYGPAGNSTVTSSLEPPTKKIRPAVEVPAIYSDAVRKKLASTSRTGQACDRCKERKMKCDTNPVACQPCRQKNLRCYTTDRVTGQSRERGQTDRAESELQMLREQNAAYQKKYGPLQPAEYQQATYSPVSDTANDRSQQSVEHVPERDQTNAELPTKYLDPQYLGWPAPLHIEPLHSGPVNGTRVDILDGIIDIADFPCDMMDEYPISNLNVFNMSRTSVMNTLTGYQNVTDPRFPSKDQAVVDANTFLVILAQYVPILHRPSFIEMVKRIYDQPGTVSQSERVQLAVVLGVVEQQMGTRNHREAAEKFEQSYHHIHYALTYYRELLRERTLASMQALALILVYFRNLPKPGYTWGFGHNILVKVMEHEYHRDPDKIQLPPSENNPLAKELRKRVFHSILGICVTTGCRVGRPAPWQFCHMDIPLPMPIKDSEISEQGLITPLSGSCEFWPCIQLAKLLPLLTEKYNHVTSVRRTEKEYVKTVEILHAKIDAWRRDWDECIRQEEKHVNLNVATLLVEGWAAEYALNLYHPSLCPTRSPEVMDRHLDVCHKQAQRLLKSFHTLSGKYKGVDFTWHSTVAYALGFGLTLHVFQKRKARVSSAQYDSMKNELKGWMSLMAYADLVLRTRNHLQHIFEPRVRRLEADYQELVQPSLSEQTPGVKRQDSISTPTPTPTTPLGRPSIKPDPSPMNVVPHGMDMRPSSGSQDMPNITYAQAQSASNHQQWVNTAQYTSQRGSITPTYITHTSSGTPTYSAYTTHTPQYSTLPTSLAPLLNDQSSGYMTYPPSTNPQNEMMMFHPNHYRDGPATMMWPLITLPPQAHDQQQTPHGNLKFN